MTTEREKIGYWQANALKVGKDISVGPFEVTPKNMTENATLGWGAEARSRDDFSRTLQIKSPRWIMFSSPRPPQDTESRFDAQLCFPVERPKNFPYTDAELANCKAFVECMKKLNRSLLKYYLDNCQRVINWDALRTTMGYKKKGEEIPLDAMQGWVKDQPKLLASVFDFREDMDLDEVEDDMLGETLIQDTRWYKIKVKINAELPKQREFAEYVFGGRKTGDPTKKRKSITVVTNSTLASNVFVDLTIKVNGKKEYIDLWPRRKDDDEEEEAVQQPTDSRKLKDLINHQMQLQEQRRAIHERVGRDVNKIMPRCCTGQSTLTFSHLMRKFDDKGACIPTVRIFANRHTIIHPQQRQLKRVMEMDEEAPDELFDEGPAQQDDDFFSTLTTTTTTTTTADALFNNDGGATKDADDDAQKFKKFKKEVKEEGKKSVSEMKADLMQKASARDKDEKQKGRDK